MLSSLDCSVSGFRNTYTFLDSLRAEKQFCNLVALKLPYEGPFPLSPPCTESGQAEELEAFGHLPSTTSGWVPIPPLSVLFTVNGRFLCPGRVSNHHRNKLEAVSLII